MRIAMKIVKKFSNTLKDYMIALSEIASTITIVLNITPWDWTQINPLLYPKILQQITMDVPKTSQE